MGAVIDATHRVTELRFREDGSEPMPPFYLSCNLVWESQSVVWVTMMTGAIKRGDIRELESWLRDHGVRMVKAFRTPGHTLPGFRPVGAHYEREIRA